MAFSGGEHLDEEKLLQLYYFDIQIITNKAINFNRMF
jgi:hypothetical protein